MNKQYLLNNLWWGENSREHNRQELGLMPAVFVSPDNSRIWGTDHSGWDGNVNMNAVKANGASFTILKCMDGTVPSRYWLENRNRAIASGLIVGDYCWLYPNNKVSARAQAQAVWNHIKDQPKQLPLTVDFEWTRYMGQPANPIYADLDIFVTEFTRLSGYEPMVYSAAGYMNPMGRMPDSLRAKISHFWFANYGVLSPTLPFGFSRWDFWQFACTGDATVISPNDAGKLATDLNYWYSNLESLRRAAGLGSVVLPPIEPLPPPDPIEPEPEPGLWEGTVVSSAPMIIRTYPVTTAASATTVRVQQGETFKGRLWVGNGYVWMSIDAAVRPELIGRWVAVRSLGYPVSGYQFIRLVGVAAEQPTTPVPAPGAGVPPPVTLPQLWRVRHDALPLWRANLPEVHSMFPNHFSAFGREWQLLERQLNKHLSDQKWRAGHGYKRAMNNHGNGYGGPGEPLADYINGVVSSKNPKQEALLMGGAIVAGHPEGMYFVVDTLDASGPVPKLEDLKPWHYFTAVNIDDGTVGGVKQGIVRRFMNGEEFFYLILADRRRYPKVTIPLWKMEKLDMSLPVPSPYRWP